MGRLEHGLRPEIVVAPLYGVAGDGGLSVASIANGDYTVFWTCVCI